MFIIKYCKFLFSFSFFGPSHVDYSQKDNDRQCYDWTYTNFMFRILIGICTLICPSFTEPFCVITFSFEVHSFEDLLTACEDQNLFGITV
ncbi:hypothetical protein C5167_006355 [Papaver somniferum]|uniref:Uncharacterized protein n=1 Tax=Papaver somniferum TaxID=3469 RepID=A0A4Y7JGX4_PAPSO|nr:hypothetical protein C5167_006355 [Papaver somniferum]